jgi:hypothetical protein
MTSPTYLAAPAASPGAAEDDGCAWWDLICQSGEQVADSGLSAITHSTIDGLVALFSMVTMIVDESTRVPLSDPTYRDTYFGFVGLAVPVIVVVYFLALIAAVLRRDPHTLTRATLGIAVAAVGGAAYIAIAQLLVALDDWLAHGVVAVTGSDFGEQMRETAAKFDRMGSGGELAVNMLLLVLMFFTLIAGICLWVVLLLRKIAILVVVVFAPFLMAGWLWQPTRSWSRRATEVLIALVFSKTVIYVIFGVGLSLLFRGDSQTLTDLVAVVVLLCGACFAPIVMLRLVHFATDSQLAGEMFSTLRAGAMPVVNRVRGGVHKPSRSGMARDYANASDRHSHTSSSDPKARGATVGPQTESGPHGGSAGTPAPTGGAQTAGAPAGGGAAGSGGSAGAAGGAKAAGGAGAAVGIATAAASTAVKTSADVGKRGGKSMQDLSGGGRAKPATTDEASGPTQRGPRAGDT